MNELDRLLTVLEAMRRRWLRGRALRVVARVAGLLAALLLVAHGLVRVLGLTGAPLVLVVAAALVTTAVVATSAAWPLVRRPSDRDVARFVEERWSDSEQRLVSAIDARPTALKPLLVREAATLVEQLDPDIVFPIEPRRRAVRWAMAACAALAASLVATNNTTVRAGRTAWFALRPAAFELHVQPGHARVVTGEPLTLAATLGGVPRGVEPPAVEVQIKGAGADATHTMERDGARYRLRLPRITSGFEYQVIAGAVSSEKYRVQMLHRPRVARVDVSYEYPPFTGLPPRREEDSGDVYAPLGTRITLHVRANKPLQSATLVRTDSDARQPMRTDGGRLAEAGFTLEGHGAYRIALNDVDGLKSPGETEYFLRVMDDRPPEVRVSRPAGDRTATRLEEVRIEARADDDHGVDRLELVYSVGGGTERRVRLGSGGRSVAGAHTLYLEDLDVQPGDFITYYARAFDVGRGKKPTEARSDMFFVEVRPFAEEFVAAQSQAMALVGGGGGQDALAAAQKDIIIATWKLERRSGAGRSVEDIRALARAQGELRDRATQQAGVAAALARRDAGAGEPRQADKPPIVLAAEAMGRAASALGSLRTSAALPHEMEALNQLLRMDAEAQQRQVSRQRGGSGSGRRTGTEDLSALFDRELMREQTTNYEQQTTTEQRPERQGTSALDRIRELARRQDELARTQQELARNQARLGDEEFKRRLERLTREQEELLRQVQRVAQEMAASNEAQGQSSSQGGRTGQGGRAGDESSQQRERDGSPRAGTSADRLRRAADEMRGATSDLQRADPAQAANRSQRTLERLSEAERMA
jgi:hypothetical protein